MMRITGGELRGRSIQTLKGQQTRPTSSKVREAVFNILRDHLPGSRWLDLFGGSGIMGIEALSRGAAHATFVESSPAAFLVLKSNLQRLGLMDRVTLMRGDALMFLRRTHLVFDLAYVDPPWGKNLYGFILGGLGGHLAPQALVLCEHSAKLILPAEAPGLEVVEQRLYGDIGLTLYQRAD